MLTVYTSTFCRPDYVQLLADCLRATVQEPYRFVVYVQHGGLAREWRGVDEVIRQTRAGYDAWLEITPALADGTSVIIHDDCVPVLPWCSSSFPLSHCGRFGGWTLQYHAGAYKEAAPVMLAERLSTRSSCAPGWSDELCEAAVAANCESLLGGTFVHIDKGTIGSLACSANAAKPALVQAIARFVGVTQPDALTPEEMAVHPGRNFAAVVRRADTSSRRGLGDWVADGLSAIGITQERVSAVTGAPCDCPGRQRAMNAFGAKYLGLPPGRSAET